MAIVPSTLRDIDRGLFRIVGELRQLGTMETRVGIHDDAQHRDPARGVFQSTAAIGAIHEFGAPGARIPRRPWLSSSLEENLGKLSELKVKLLRAIYDGKLEARRALALLGQAHEDQIKAKITAGPWVPLALRTLAARAGRKLNNKFKGQRPLVDTGQMRASIRHVEGERTP